LHKKNITIPPGPPKDRFVFYSYISVVPQNEFVFQGIFVIAVLESDHGVLGKREGFFCLISRHCNYTLEEKESAIFIEVVIRDCRPGVMSVI